MRYLTDSTYKEEAKKRGRKRVAVTGAEYLTGEYREELTFACGNCMKTVTYTKKRGGVVRQFCDDRLCRADRQRKANRLFKDRHKND